MTNVSQRIVDTHNELCYGVSSMTDIGRRIKEARERKGLTREQLQLLLEEKGVSRHVNTIANWETGQTEPKYSEMMCMCDLLAPYLVLDDPQEEVHDAEEEMETAAPSP